MGWFTDFLEKRFVTKQKVGGDSATITIDIPSDLYYKELAMYTAVSLISNAISRSEIKCFVDNKPQKNEDYYLLNVSPNKNETSSIFWHKVINTMIRKEKALVVEAGGRLYCAESYALREERPVLGDIFEGVTVGNLQFDKIFYPGTYYLFQLDNICAKKIVDGMYEEYGKIMSAAAKSFKHSNGQKYKLHIDGVKAEDEDFQKEFENTITEQLKKYIKSEDAVYPEFDGYDLEPDKSTGTPRSSEDFIKLKKELFSTVASAFHIPDSMMTGNITNMSEVIGSFLSFGVDPYADAISEGLNKRGGLDNFLKGNFYQVDTGKIHHRDLFGIATGVSNLISSGVMCIDEVREELGKEPLNTWWSQKHFITKNFEEIERFLKTVEGGEKSEKKVLPNLNK